MEFVIDDKITRKEDDPLYAHMTREQIIQMDLEIEKSKMYTNYGQNDPDWSPAEKFDDLDQLNRQIAAQEPRTIFRYDQPLVHDKINVTKTYSKEDIAKSPFLSFPEEENHQNFDHNCEPNDETKKVVKDYISILKSLGREASNLAVKSIYRYVYDKQYKEQHDQLIKSCFMKILKRVNIESMFALDENNFYEFLNLYINKKGEYCGSPISLPLNQQKNWYTLINEFSAGDGITIQDFIQFQTIVKCTADTFSEEPEFWKKFRLWSEKNVTYSKVVIEPYQLNIFDKQKFPSHLKNGWPFQQQKLKIPFQTKLIDMQILSHFEEDLDLSQRFLRVMQRQVMKSQQGKEIECHIMKLFLFDEQKQKFELQYNSIYDISKEILDSSTNSFTNECFFAKQNFTYYFRKQKNQDGCRGFQLYRHAMSEGRFYCGIQPKMEPEGEMKDTYFINVEKILKHHKLELDNLGIFFLKDANKEYEQNYSYHEQRIDSQILKNQFVCIYQRKKLKSSNTYTFVKIYLLKNHNSKHKGMLELNEPMIDVDKSIIQSLQTGFVWGDNPINIRDGSIFNFTLKGQRNTYDIKYEYRNLDEAQESAESITQPKPRVLKQRHKVCCYKFAEHMYQINFRKILLPYSSQEVELVYYHNYNAYNIQLINPILDLTYNPVAPGINNQQDEAAFAISQICNYDKQDKTTQSVVYEDQYFTFCDNNQFRSSVLYHIDQIKPGRDYDEYDNYFSNKNMIIKTNHRSNLIHVWSVNPNYLNSTFLDQLKQTQNKLFYQTNIFKRFDRRNIKPKFYQQNYTCKLISDTREPFAAQQMPIYIHKSKNKVTTGHNLITINEKDYECHENLLVIDLSDRKDGRLSLIQLIHPDLKDLGIRLVKYFICYSKEPKKAVFFFQQRNQNKIGCVRDKSTSGLYFFVEKTLEDLKDLANSYKSNQNIQERALIKEGETEITILESTKTAYQVIYDSQFVTQKQNNLMRFHDSNIDIKFDLVQDMNQQQIDFIIPFYFTSYRTIRERKRKNDNRLYNLYMAFLDITKFKWEKDNEKMNSPNNKYITFIKHNNYRYIHEHELNKTSAENQNINLYGLAETCFSRVSQWSTNPLQLKIQNNNITSEISAKFIIGSSFHGLDEYQEILVTVDAKNKNPISIKYLALYWSCIVPKVDNNGLFHGSYLMDNTMTTHSVPLRIKTYEEGFKQSWTSTEANKAEWNDNQYMLAGQYMELDQINNTKMITLRNYKNQNVYLPPQAIRDLTYDHHKDTEKYKQTHYKYDFTQFPDDYVSICKFQDLNKCLMCSDDEEKSNIEGLQQIGNCFDKQCQFKFISQGKDMYIIQTFQGEYLTMKIMNDTDILFAQKEQQLAEVFQPKKLKGGKWALKGSNDQYLELKENNTRLGQTCQWSKQLELQHIFEIEKYQPWAYNKYYDLERNFINEYNMNSAYVIVELNDDRLEEDPHMILETPFTQLGNKKFVQNGRYNTQANSILTTKLLKQVLQENIYDVNHQLIELYKSNSSNLCMSVNNFFEVYKMGGDNQEQRLKHYFQPKLLFNGKSMCSFEFDKLSKRSYPLKKALHIYYQYEICALNVTVQNSECTVQHNIKTAVNSQTQQDHVGQLFQLFGINLYQNFQSDLNHKSLIYEGLRKNYNNVVRLIMETIVKKMNDGIYQELIIQELPELFCQQNINIDEFLTKSVADEKDDDFDSIYYIENCNLESKLRDSKLPFLGKANTSYFEQKQFLNIYNLREELESKIKNDKLKEKSPQKNKGESMIWDSFYQSNIIKDDVEVVYNVINFFPIIRKTKIALYLGWGQEDIKDVPTSGYMKKVRQQFAQHPEDFNRFNDVLFAELILNQRDNKEFFECTAINTLIDRQYQRTISIYWMFMLLYFFTFIIPFGITIVFYNRYEEVDQISNNTRVVLSIICLISQIGFWLLEFIQIDKIGRKENGKLDCRLIWKQYFLGWGMADFIQPFVYVIHKVLWFNFDFEESPNAQLAYQLFTITQMSLSYIKLTWYLRYHARFSFLIRMFDIVFFDLFEFLVITAILILLFSFMLISVGGEVDGGDYEDWSSIGATIIQMSRNSIGDLAVLKIGKWQVDYEAEETPTFSQFSAIFLVWGIWFADLIIMVVVMLNFLIAEVSQTYERVMTQGLQFLYINKADCNMLSVLVDEYYNQYILGRKPGANGYQAIIFKTPAKLNKDDANSQISGFTTVVKKDAIVLLNKHKNELVKYIKQTDQIIYNTKEGSLYLLAHNINTIKRLHTKTEESLNKHVEEKIDMITKKTDQFIERAQKINARFARLDECKSTMKKILEYI